jgi:hypothetical protein
MKCSLHILLCAIYVPPLSRVLECGVGIIKEDSLTNLRHICGRRVHDIIKIQILICERRVYGYIEYKGVGSISEVGRQKERRVMDSRDNRYKIGFCSNAVEGKEAGYIATVTNGA